MDHALETQREAARTRPGHLLTLLLCCAVLLHATCIPPQPPPALAGLPEYQAIAAIPVPGGARVNVTGGNLILTRTDLAIDTQLGPYSVGATWNSVTKRWQWSFDGVQVSAGSFTDSTGWREEIAPVANGGAFAGTSWVRVNYNACYALQVKTKGGLQHDFRCDGLPLYVHWSSSYEPYLMFTPTRMGDGELHTSDIQQCLAAGGGCHPLFTMSYDAQGRVTGITDRAGRTALFAYDANGRLAQARDALDVDEGWAGTRYAYDTAGNLSAVTNSEGERVEYDYNGVRVITVRQIGLGNPTQTFAYEGKNAAGLNVTRHTDALGNETRFRYDDDRQLREVESMGTGEKVTRSWADRRVTSLTRPDATTTSFTYANDDVATRTDPSGNVTTFTYQANGVDRDRPQSRPILAIHDGVGPVEARTYDGAGRLLSVANGASDATTYAYGADEMIATRTTPAGLVWTYQAYGEHGHPTTIVTGNGTYPLAYDAVGNRTKGDIDEQQPEAGGVVAREYDADRNVSAILVADNSAFGPYLYAPERIEIAHRSDHRRVAITRPRNANHQFQYDALGRQVATLERVDGAWQTTTYSYDAAGRIMAVELPNGMRRESTYDAIGRMVGFSAERSGVLEGTATFQYGAGRLLSIQDTQRNGTELYGYDAAGRLSQVVWSSGERTLFQYDLRSRRTREQLVRSDGSVLRTLDYEHDLADRDTVTRESSVPILSRSWANGRVASIAYGNGLTRSFGYEPTTGFPSGSTTVNALGATVETTLSSQEPSSGMLLVESDTTTRIGASGTTYDGFYLAPLGGCCDPGDTLQQGKRVVWDDVDLLAWDSLGNRYWEGTPETSQDFHYNAERNRIVSATVGGASVAYTHDAAGFVTSRGGVPLTWTATGMLATHGTTSLAWDMLGRLVSTTVGGQTTRWLWGGRVQGDAAGNPLAIELGEVRINLDGTHLYRHLDFRKNVKFTTNDVGAVVAHYDYGSFGVQSVLGTDTDPYRFAGRQALGDLVILGRRVYDPLIGRFVSQDPILNLINQYAYTLGNPIWFADPGGELTAAQVAFLFEAGSFVAGSVATAAAYTPGAQGIAIGAAFVALLLGLGAAAANAAGSSSGNSSTSNGGGSGGGGSGGGGAGAAGEGGIGVGVAVAVPGCAPAGLAVLPAAGSLFVPLLLLQLLLAAAVLRRRATRC